MPFLLRSKKNSQRKYIDLINEASSKWANWDPPRRINPGDFGTVIKSTGELVVEGNIYTHADLVHIARKYPPSEGHETDRYHIHSYEVRGVDVGADLGANLLGIQGLVFKSRWQFNSKRGAVLLMYQPRLITVPDAFFTETQDVPILKNKSVVYQVFNCPGFYMYLSNKASEQISVSLRANTLPGVDGEQALSVGWSADGSSGVCQQGFREDAVYTPLFRLKSLGRRHWRRDGITPMIEKWEVTYIPWGILDEDGESESESDDDDDDDDD
ncbi:hypothetical protein EDB89DRAFT_2115623 [Lactarius sanguifluus]|nr:hypothetical protein EDB89DRAFT_2115623 [Lactarius sanguifluus]